VPFKSQQQRALFQAALTDPDLRKKHGLSLSVIRKMLDEDEGGKLPKRIVASRETRKAIKRGRIPTGAKR
jgi:hypothetical protein